MSSAHGNWCNENRRFVTRHAALLRHHTALARVLGNGSIELPRRAAMSLSQSEAYFG